MPDDRRSPREPRDDDTPEPAADYQFPSDEDDLESMELDRATEEGLVPPGARTNEADHDANERSEEDADA